MRYADLDRDIRDRMIKEFDRFEAEGTLFVPGFLTKEGKEWYSSIFRDALLSGFDDDWLVDQLLNQKLVASEAPGRIGGPAARAVSPATLTALVVGETNRLCCRAICQTADDAGVPEVVVCVADKANRPTGECLR